MAMAKKSKAKKPKAKPTLMSIKVRPETYQRIVKLKSHPKESFDQTLRRLASIAEKLQELKEYPRELPEDILDRLMSMKKPQQAEREGFLA